MSHAQFVSDQLQALCQIESLEVLVYRVSHLPRLSALEVLHRNRLEPFNSAVVGLFLCTGLDQMAGLNSAVRRCRRIEYFGSGHRCNTKTPTSYLGILKPGP